MDTKIIRVENIKPETPTPQHLRTYRLSLLDQLNSPIYVNLVHFYASCPQRTHSELNSTLSDLRKSLSKALVMYYPLGGKCSNDGLLVDCNDEGVYYVEALVTSQSVEQFLSKFDIHSLRWLVPEDPFGRDTGADHHVLMIQVNIFEYGGMAITTSTWHKVVDGSTAFCFNKAWAAIACGSSEFSVPDFKAPSLFPQDPLLPRDSTMCPWMVFFTPEKCMTRRFVFDSLALRRLKTRASCSTFVQHPSRFEVVLALIWSAMAASRKMINRSKRTSIISSAVDLRRRMVPRLTNQAIGNIVWTSTAVCSAEDRPELQRLVGTLREAAAKIDSKFISKIRNQFHTVYREFWESYSMKDADFFSCASLPKELYEVDFGWGEPIWVCPGQTDFPWTRNYIFLLETKSGDGIEAWVRMSEQDMSVLERDAELLEYASVDPCPLRVCNTGCRSCL